MSKKDIILINKNGVIPIERFIILNKKENINFLHGSISKQFLESNIKDSDPIYFEIEMIDNTRYIKILIDVSNNKGSLEGDFIEIGNILENT